MYPPSAAAELGRLGHDALSVAGSALAGSDDELLYELAASARPPPRRVGRGQPVATARRALTLTASHPLSETETDSRTRP